MVVDTRFELVTPAMSMQCSTAELIDHDWKTIQDARFVRSCGARQDYLTVYVPKRPLLYQLHRRFRADGRA